MVLAAKKRTGACCDDMSATDSSHAACARNRIKPQGKLGFDDLEKHDSAGCDFGSINLKYHM